MTDETFPPCWACDHPMLAMPVGWCDSRRYVSCDMCPACGAATVVPFAYPRVVDFTAVLSGIGELPQK